MGAMVGLLLFLAAAADAAQPFNPRAIELVERDWVVMQWAKRIYDANRDGIISVEEAQPAARAFRDIADGDGDGRVTPYEYDRAREFILARH
jgi:hypothetical protein